MSVFILVRYLLVLFWLSFGRFGNRVCEVKEPNWGSLEHNLFKMSGGDSVSELHGLTTASFPHHILNCIVASSHNTHIPYIVTGA